ncbi:hypothetical protein Leryth_001955 [Lithospermum erythrorhizon]|nr:hypothetical protein Leryth_001955 [Lithospermum erythrorhizon]
MAPGINGMVSLPTLSEIRTVGLVQSLKYHVPTSCMLRPCATKTSSKAKIASGNSSSSSSRNVEKINGKKVNGVHVIGMPPKGGIINDNSNNNSGNRTSSNLEDDPIRPYLLGRFYEDGYIFRQTFVIRSYEIGPDKTATMETIMNLLQETALNQVSSSGVGGDGFGATREMGIRKLIWVVTRIHVQIEKYSSWGDFVEIDTWVDAAGKNGMRRDWVIRDCKTQKIITRATSTWVTMNRETRKLSKIPDEVKSEIQPFYLNREAIKERILLVRRLETLKLQESHGGAIWMLINMLITLNTLDGWSMPIGVLQDYSLTSMTLEYRRECRLSNVLDSLTSIKPKMDGESMKHSTTGIEGLECTHLLRMQADNAEIIRARSIWKSKERPTN